MPSLLNFLRKKVTQFYTQGSGYPLVANQSCVYCTNNYKDILSSREPGRAHRAEVFFLSCGEA